MGNFRYVQAGEVTLHPHRCAFWSIDGGDLIDLGVDVDEVDDPVTRRLYMSVEAAKAVAKLVGFVSEEEAAEVEALRKKLREAEMAEARARKALERFQADGFITTSKCAQRTAGVVRAYKQKVDKANQNVKGFTEVPLPSKAEWGDE